MSSHREAPEISKDPVADSTDVYAFVSPDKPTTATLIANYVPLQAPAGGPNFYEFGDDVLYEIHVDNNGDALPNVTYQFRFTSVLTNPKTFLYNTGPITITNGSLNLASWNRRQFFSVTRVVNGVSTVLASDLACPPCNIGPLSTPNYADTPATAGSPEPFTQAFIYDLPSGETVFAGQRAEGFYVDLGAVFDLGDLRPIAEDHATFGLPVLQGMPGVNTTAAVNIHSIAIQVPIKLLTSNGTIPTDPTAAASTIGVYTTASRQKVKVLGGTAADVDSGPYVQVSRMGNPLFNEVLVPLSQKDYWNAVPPSYDSHFAAGVLNPELGQLLPILYTPNGGTTVFPHLAALNAQITAGTKSRGDLEAVLLTGIPTGVVPLGGGAYFQNVTTPNVPSDMLRLNMAYPPATTALSNLGVVGGDVAGFPNGRRVFDDVTNIELKAIAGAIYGLVDPTFTADAAVGLVDEGLTSSATDQTAKGSVAYLRSFPYLGTPHGGYLTPPTTPSSSLV